MAGSSSTPPRRPQPRGGGASPDHLIGASRLADALAALRRRRAGLAEVLDAARRSSWSAEDLARASTSHVVGDGIGDVPEAPQVPLARDLAAQRRRLKPASRRRRSSSTCARERSAPIQLLHRLGRPRRAVGRPTRTRGSSGTFRETWTLAWEPELSVRPRRAPATGRRWRRAATLVGRARDRRRRLPTPRRLVELALLADLPEARGAACGCWRSRPRHAPDVAELMDALGPLAARCATATSEAPTRARSTVVDEVVVRAVAGLRARPASPRR